MKRLAAGQMVLPLLSPCRAGPAPSPVRPGAAAPVDSTSGECFLLVWHFPPRQRLELNKLENMCWFGKDICHVSCCSVVSLNTRIAIDVIF